MNNKKYLSYAFCATMLLGVTQQTLSTKLGDEIPGLRSQFRALKKYFNQNMKKNITKFGSDFGKDLRNAFQKLTGHPGITKLSDREKKVWLKQNIKNASELLKQSKLRRAAKRAAIKSAGNVGNMSLMKRPVQSIVKFFPKINFVWKSGQGRTIPVWKIAQSIRNSSKKKLLGIGKVVAPGFFRMIGGPIAAIAFAVLPGVYHLAKGQKPQNIEPKHPVAKIVFKIVAALAATAAVTVPTLYWAKKGKIQTPIAANAPQAVTEEVAKEIERIDTMIAKAAGISVPELRALLKNA